MGFPENDAGPLLVGEGRARAYTDYTRRVSHKMALLLKDKAFTFLERYTKWDLTYSIGGFLNQFNLSVE